MRCVSTTGNCTNTIYIYNIKNNYRTLLQIMGFEVDAINSVQLSNHTGYKTYYGQILNESNLCKLFIYYRYLQYFYIYKIHIVIF